MCAPIRPLLPVVAVLVTALASCSTAPEEPRTRPDAALVVVSYNIRHGQGGDGVLDLERTAAVLRALDPDLVALQEVDENVERSGGVDQAAWLGGQLGMAHAFGAFMDYQGGRYGMAILSRYPILHAEPIELPRGNEPRVALQVEVALPEGGTLRALCVHFDWVRDDAFRFAQAEALAAHLDALEGRTLVLGDFNDRPGSRTLALFGARAREADKLDDARWTFPADDPDREIDFVFAAPPAAWDVAEVRVVDERVASDHRPVLAVLRPRGD